MKISAIVTLKKEVLDPQGKVVNQTLKNMGYQNITNVRQGKYFEIEVNESDKDKAKIVAEEICKTHNIKDPTIIYNQVMKSVSGLFKKKLKAVEKIKVMIIADHAEFAQS